MGRSAAGAVSRAREDIANLLGCSDKEIVFTSGATESNNLVLFGLARYSENRKKIITTAIEHKSVLEPCTHLLEMGFEVVQVPVTFDGIIDLDAAKSMIDDSTLVVSVQGANNEIGTIQPVKKIANIAHSLGALVHCDATQLLGKVHFGVDDLGVDYLSLSAHKAYGPKGVGVLFVRNGTPRSRLYPVIFGGGQEYTLRPGTSNVPSIAGFGEACRIISKVISDDIVRIERLRDILECRLLECIPEVLINGAVDLRLPGTISLTIRGVPGDMLIAQVPSICITSGSACTSSAITPSHVMLACGHSRENARCTVRISIGRYNTEEEIHFAAAQIADGVARIKNFVQSY